MRGLDRTGFRAVVALLLLAGCGGAAFGQQNLFNVPSGQITKPGNLFFQEQLNFAHLVGTSNTTIDFGLGRGWEVGFNVLDVSLYDRTPETDALAGPKQVNPDLLFNAQKGFELTEFWDLAFGGQFGFNPARDRKERRFQEFVWAITELEIPERKEFGKYYLGLYQANTAYGGPGERVGFMLGVEIPIIPERLSFQADYISGNRDISVAVIGGVYTFKSGWQLSAGLQVPAPRSQNPYGLVLEFTYPGLPLFAGKGAR
jgi:hypothetical protein